MKPLFFIFFLLFLSCDANEFPVLHEGRYVPAESYFQKILKEKKISLKNSEFSFLLAYFLNEEIHGGNDVELKVLPSKYQEGVWLPLKTLELHASHTRNYTLFSDEDFKQIKHAYEKLKNEGINEKNAQAVSLALLKAYLPISGTKAKTAHGKSLTYPSHLQLKAENFYSKYPWNLALLILYGMSTLFLRLRKPFSRKIGLITVIIAFALHTGLIATRSFILERPPVSNMFETVLYVPWIGVAICFLFPVLRKQPYALLAASLASTILFAIIETTSMDQDLVQVQPVLDSGFWLLIHVLLVVGSYGMFILAAVLAHIYLIFFIFGKKHPSTQSLPNAILQSMYAGTALLISGTILGGIWAAQSWGRFWDWDPKESWAFISSCFYLIWIHAYRFKRISSFGLSFGASAGLLAISFTWYGVNYILGTGLHSYGFGQGGQIYYYFFFLAECLFLFFTLWFHYRNENLVAKRE